jgi:hypothetical protein
MSVTRLLGRLSMAFAVRTMITAIGTKRARAIGNCRSFLQEGKRRAGSNQLEGSNSNHPTRHDEFVPDKSDNRDPEATEAVVALAREGRPAESNGDMNPVPAASSLIAALRSRASETEMLERLPDATVGDLTAGLKNCEPQNEINQGEGPFSRIYAEPARLKQFLCA